MKETTLSKALGLGIIISGAVLLYQNRKRDGVWMGVVAGMLVTGAVTVKFYSTSDKW